MGGWVDGRIALVTGAARGQGRSHAVRLAKEGADIIAIDICGPVGETGSTAAPSTPRDLAFTAELVNRHRRRVVTAQVDIRDGDALDHAVADAVEELGGLDIVVANAGIGNGSPTADAPSRRNGEPRTDLGRSGMWKTVKAAVPHLLTTGTGSIVITSPLDQSGTRSHTGLDSAPTPAVIRMMRNLAIALAPHSIRCNSIHPAQPGTPILTDDTGSIARPDPGDPGNADHRAITPSVNRTLLGWASAPDIGDAVVFLASSESAYITGIHLDVDVNRLLI